MGGINGMGQGRLQAAANRAAKLTMGKAADHTAVCKQAAG